MNLGVVTINLVKIALETNTIEEYMELLEERVGYCKEALDFRIKSLDRVQSKNAPILYMYGATGFRLEADEYVKDKFKNGYASVSLGYIGIHEIATKFYGEQWQSNKEAKDFTLRVMKFLKDSVDKWKKETGYGFGLYGTPSESLTDRFCRIDQENFGDIKGITDKGYYTNSFHLDVNCQATPFEKLAFEQEYLQYTSGGFINYVEADSLVNNPKALETIWDYACDIGIGYCGVNTPIDKCFKCGYEGEFTASAEGFKCPNCGNTDPKTSSCVRRVCGYLSSPNKTGYNRGKNIEISRRVKHTRTLKNRK